VPSVFTLVQVSTFERSGNHCCDALYLGTAEAGPFFSAALKPVTPLKKNVPQGLKAMKLARLMSGLKPGPTQLGVLRLG
jgi:hypothetical protein